VICTYRALTLACHEAGAWLHFLLDVCSIDNVVGCDKLLLTRLYGPINKLVNPRMMDWPSVYARRLRLFDLDSIEKDGARITLAWRWFSSNSDRVMFTTSHSALPTSDSARPRRDLPKGP
jgi:hypothetical protein